MATKMQVGSPKATKGWAKRKTRDVLAIAPSTNLLLNLLMVILCAITLFPIYVIVIASVTSSPPSVLPWPKSIAA